VRPAEATVVQRWRVLAQAAFFALFVLAPPLDLLRFDLTRGHAILLGHPWRLGLDELAGSPHLARDAAVAIVLKLLLPIFAVALSFLAVAWRWGRLYCGWLCPHFSVVETINDLMRRAWGRPSLWDAQPAAPRNIDGTPFAADRRAWAPLVLLAVAFAATWSVVLLTYLLPPATVYGDILRGAPTRNEALFVGVGTLVFSADFLFARHLFCRYGCAVGLFQSLVWMSHRGARVIGFDRARAADCARCRSAPGPGHWACEIACPMRLKPRGIKSALLACTQCARCLDACATVQRGQPSLLRWISGEEARRQQATVSLIGTTDSWKSGSANSGTG
jgi:polyferredoxin